MSSLDVILLVVATVLIFFLPGFVWSFAFFDSRADGGVEKKPLETSERIMWSFVLSLAIVPLSFFVINSLVGMPVNGYSVFGLMVFLCLLGVLVYWIGSKCEFLRRR